MDLSSMKTHLRNKRTGSYFQGVSDWTTNVREAFDFKMPERAIRFVKDAGLKAVDLVLAFDDPHYNIHLPVDERFGLSTGNGRKPGTRQTAQAGA